MADTHEIVINWDDGAAVHIEVVPAVALARPTRRMTQVQIRNAVGRVLEDPVPVTTEG